MAHITSASTRTPSRVAWAKVLVSYGAGYAPIVRASEVNENEILFHTNDLHFNSALNILTI